MMAASILLAPLLPLGPNLPEPGLAGRLLSSDSRWYFDIALHGYRWNPVDGIKPHHFQNVAFFPLYPLIVYVLASATGSVSLWIEILPGLVCGLAANLVFYRLAEKLLTPAAAIWATVFFVVWPAGCFLVMGYPTGLTNLCTLLCLNNYVAGRRLRAAIWCGLGTASAPTLVFVAAGLCCDTGFRWLRAGRPVSKIPSMLLFGSLSVSGLLAFMAYLYWYFADAVAFSHAQQAWEGMPKSLSAHLLTLIDPAYYCNIFVFIFSAAYSVVHDHALVLADGRDKIVIVSQWVLNMAVVFAGMVLAIKSFRQEQLRPLAFAGLAVLIGYLWFVGTDTTYFSNGTRLLYPASIMFISFGQRAASSGNGYRLATASAAVSIFFTMLMLAGYSII